MLLTSSSTTGGIVETLLLFLFRWVTSIDDAAKGS